MPTQYSIVVPAYKECANLDALTRRTFAAMAERGFDTKAVEMIVVDDNSRDGTVEKIDSLSKEGFNVTVQVRTHMRGLSSAVIAGLRSSAGAYMIVMDADLQHPPESVPDLFRALEQKDVEFVCGTRYGAGVQIDEGWPLHRRVISWGARLLARPLCPLSDPMSGFFGLRKSVFDKGVANVNPIGYKIALELFVKCHIKVYREISFNFATRQFGESKLTGKVIIGYLQHLFTLYSAVLGPLFYVLLVIAVVVSMMVVAYVATSVAHLIQ